MNFSDVFVQISPSGSGKFTVRTRIPDTVVHRVRVHLEITGVEGGEVTPVAHVLGHALRVRLLFVTGQVVLVRS